MRAKLRAKIVSKICLLYCCWFFIMDYPDAGQFSVVTVWWQLTSRATWAGLLLCVFFLEQNLVFCATSCETSSIMWNELHIGSIISFIKSLKYSNFQYSKIVPNRLKTLWSTRNRFLRTAACPSVSSTFGRCRHLHLQSLSVLTPGVV